MTDVLADRARIQQEISGRTLVDLLRDTSAAFADETAYSDRHHVTEGWRTLTWRETYDLALDVAAGLIAEGVQIGDTVAIMATNRIEHQVADMGGVNAAAVPMSIYNTLAVDQVTYIAGQSAPVVAILENADNLARWSGALDAGGVARVVVLDDDAVPEGELFVSWAEFVAKGAAYRAENPDAVAERQAAVRGSSPATYLYTSGTTGNPKGVELTHDNVLYEVVASQEAGGIVGRQRQISYLPLAHIAERVLSLYGPQIQGSHTYCIGDPAELLATLGEVHPTAFFGVPRVWEKIKTGISAKLAADPDPANVAMVQECMAAALAWVEAQETGGVMTPEIEAAYQKADETILGFLKLLLGLDQVTWTASASAPMPVEVTRFMAGLGLKVYDVYGMTETTGAATVNGPGGFRLGTVGRPIPGVELMLGEDNEVLMRGPIMTPGYHRNSAATAGLIDTDGWVHTGDIGEIDEDGFLSIVDRKKELIITSQGKNVAPSNIENYLKESPVIGHAMAIGDGKPYVVAVLTLDGEIAPVVAEKLGVTYTDLADLSTKPEIHGMVQAAIDAANERLSRPEQVKAWALLPDEWTAESEELTPTLKLKRRVVNDKYADVVETLYSTEG